MFDLFSDAAKVAQQTQIILNEYGFATWETLYSLVLEVLFAYVIGLPVGVILFTGEKDGIKPLPGWLMTVVNAVINLLRSVPFLILMIIALPLSKLIVGTKVGTAATIPPMVIAAFPLVARMVESSLREVNQGVVEAAQSMGASTMAGIIGGGGLGKMAINYGYYNFKFLVMWAAVIGLVLLVQIFQSAGTRLAARCDKRLRNKN